MILDITSCAKVEVSALGSSMLSATVEKLDKAKMEGYLSESKGARAQTNLKGKVLRVHRSMSSLTFSMVLSDLLEAQKAA
jgi:hypothetical protein